MLFCLDLEVLDIDMYSKKIGLFYRNKEKITSYFGLTLTALYIIISLAIFIYYTLQTLKHIDLIVYDSTIYSKEIPSVNLNNSDLLYFAFAVEIPSTAARFIDETIYTVKAIFYDSIKNENGTFEMKELRELQIEKCQQEKFGLDYQHLFTKGEFNNSYCISKLDFDLTGGFIYENLSLIRLDIYPCKNSTENSYHCKPQDVIDSFLAGGYFSILLKDIGLDPNNYSHPTLPTLQDLYTTISNKFFRDLILYYEITEIKTDSGIFFENIQKKRYLKFNKKSETLFIRDQQKYYDGESIIGIQIRLSDNIHIQSREYKKMHSVFATTGGYMQMLNTFFVLLSLIPNKYLYDNLIIGNLFDFDINNNRIINKLYKKNIRFNSQRLKHELESPRSPKSFGSPRREHNFLHESKIIHLKSMNNDNKEGFVNEIKSDKKRRNINKKYLRSENSLNLSAYEKINNQSKIEIPPLKNNCNIMNNNKVHTEKNKSKKIVIETKKRDNNRMETRNFIHFKLNILDYIFMGKYNEKNKTYNLFRKGILIYKEKLDVINLFNCILFIEKRCNYGEEFPK